MTLGCYYYFFKDSRVLLELIFYVSKYKYTLHFDFSFSVWLQWEMSKFLLRFAHFIHLCFIFIYNFYGNSRKIVRTQITQIVFLSL